MPTDVTLETAIETANSAKSLRELGKGLKELISLQEQVGSKSGAEYKKLQDAITKTEGRLGDLNDSFQTLRGSGVERVNASIGLFREGLLNADTDKIKLGLQGVGSAMKAIPIFLLLEGARLLFENWEKVTAIFSSSQQQIKLNAENLEKLNEQIAFNKQETDGLLVTKQAELKLLEKQGASLQVILNKVKEVNDLKLSSLAEELKGVDKEMQNIISQLTEVKKDVNEDSITESILGFFGVGNTDKDVKELEKKLSALALKRGEIVNAQAKVEIESAETVLDKIEEARKKADELFAQQFARRRELQKRESDAEKQQIQDLLDFQLKATKKALQDLSSINDEFFLKSIERGKYEFQIEQQNLQKSLQGRIDLIVQKKKEELAKVAEGSAAAIIIEKNASQAILNEKLKVAGQTIALAQSVSNSLIAINQIITDNENYRLQQESYQKDAQIENSRNRAQEQIDIETVKTNKLLNNENLTENEREKIKFDSETRQRQIEISAKNNQLKTQQEFDKKSNEVRKVQFEREKKIQLATAAINTAAAVVSALGTVQPYPLAVAAAAGAALAGGLQIAAIANKKFDDGGASAKASVAPIASIDTRVAPSSGNAGPGPSTNFNPSGQTTGQTNNGNGAVKVYVLDSDIRDVASKVDVLEDRATFGE